MEHLEAKPAVKYIPSRHTQVTVGLTVQGRVLSGEVIIQTYKAVGGSHISYLE